MNEPSIPRDQPLRGIVLMLAALAFFSCSDAASKLMTAILPAVEVAWLRFCVFTLLILGAARMTGQERPLQSYRPVLQTLRALGLLGSSIFFIMGLSLLPMAEAAAIAFISPMIVTALSIPILGEVVGWKRWGAVVVGLLGVFIVVRPGAGAFSPAAMLPILSATSWAVALVGDTQDARIGWAFGFPHLCSHRGLAGYLWLRTVHVGNAWVARSCLGSCHRHCVHHRAMAAHFGIPADVRLRPRAVFLKPTRLVWTARLRHIRQRA